MPKGLDLVERETYVPEPALFREFADLELNRVDVLRFVDKYGHPETYGTADNLPSGRRLNFLYRRVETMRAIVHFWRQGNIGDLVEHFRLFPPRSEIKLRLITGRDTPALVIEPMTLLDAMWLQFAQAISDDTQLRQCATCPSWFVHGTGTGRRGSAAYCSDRCRKAAYDKRKRAKR